MGKKRRHWITICHADGSYSHESSVIAGNEDRHLRAGQFWIAGETNGSEFWVNPKTRRRNKKRPARVSLAENRISGLPQNATVWAKGRCFSPDENGEVVFAPALGLPEKLDVIIEAPGVLRTQVQLACCEVAECEKTGREVQITQDAIKLRRAEYPPIEDQLDALWKGGEDAQAMRSRVLAVKEKFPKPD